MEEGEEAVPLQLRPVLRELVHELVVGNFAGLEADGRAGRVRAEDLRLVIARYGRVLGELPEHAFDPRFAGAIPLGGDEAAWAVDVALWTVEEGRSDLTLQTTVWATSRGILARIEDLQVM